MFNYEDLLQYQETGLLTSGLIMEATMRYHDYDWMETYAPSWFSGSRRYGAPQTFPEFHRLYVEGLPAGSTPNAQGLIAFSWEKWDSNPMKPVYKDYQTLVQLGNQFRDTVWNRWLQAYYQKAVMRGHEVVVDGVEMLVWGAAGRVMMTIQPKGGGDSFITFVAAENEGSNLGLQGQRGTLEELSNLVLRLVMKSDEACEKIACEESITHPATLG